MVILGIDPGKVNYGWSLYTGKKWYAGALVIRGKMPYRMFKLKCWVNRIHTELGYPLDVIAVEILKGGQPWLIYDLACAGAVLGEYCYSNGISYVQILPCIHYCSVSGIGKPNSKYDSIISKVLKRKLNNMHEKTATGCALTAYMDIKGLLSARMVGKSDWLYRKEEV